MSVWTNAEILIKTLSTKLSQSNCLHTAKSIDCHFSVFVTKFEMVVQTTELHTEHSGFFFTFRLLFRLLCFAPPFLQTSPIIFASCFFALSNHIKQTKSRWLLLWIKFLRNKVPSDVKCGKTLRLSILFNVHTKGQNWQRNPSNQIVNKKEKHNHNHKAPYVFTSVWFNWVLFNWVNGSFNEIGSIERKDEWENNVIYSSSIFPLCLASKSRINKPRNIIVDIGPL